jgi:hypothetical protein
MAYFRGRRDVEEPVQMRLKSIDNLSSLLYEIYSASAKENLSR